MNRALNRAKVRKEKGKEMKAKDLSFLAGLIMTLSKKDGVEGAFGKAIILGKDIEDQVKRISKIIVSIYVAPIPILEQIEAKNGRNGECLAVDLVSKWMMELLDVNVEKDDKKNEKKDENKEEKKDEKKDEVNESKGMKTLKLKDIYEAAMKYCTSGMEGTMMAERGEDVSIIFGSFNQDIEILISKFLTWALQSSETIMFEHLSRFRNDMFGNIEKMLQKYMIETYVQDKKSVLWKSITKERGAMDLEINVQRVMKSIKNNAFFRDPKDYFPTTNPTLSKLLFEFQQYNQRIKRVPFDTMARNLNFNTFVASSDIVSQSQGAELIEKYLNWLQSEFYEKNNEQMKNSSKLLGRVLASYVLLVKGSEKAVKFTQEFKKMIRQLMISDNIFYCVSCSTKNYAKDWAQWDYCATCGFIKITFL